jgi:hypothetical protein
VVAAVGIALQHPEVQEWLEEQRQKLAQMLRSIGEGLDPQTRREAEAFAFEGRMPTQREREGMDTATAVATGRDTNDETTPRHLIRQGSDTPIDAEERRRLGREYLAKRNQELLDRKSKRQSQTTGTKPSSSANVAIEDKSNTASGFGLLDMESHDPEFAAQSSGPDMPILLPAASISASSNASRERSTNGKERSRSFDDILNDDGTLKVNDKIAPEQTSVSSRAFEAGASSGNPFGDEFAMDIDRSVTPKPPVPPKVAIAADLPGSFPSDPPISEPQPLNRESGLQGEEDLPFDEQLARALSLSLADRDETARRQLRRSQTEDEALAKAIAESLRDAEEHRRSMDLERELSSPARGPLVDFSADDHLANLRPHTPLQSNNPWRSHAEDDDLYTLTPHTTGKRVPFDPVRDAALSSASSARVGDATSPEMRAIGSLSMSSLLNSVPAAPSENRARESDTISPPVRPLSSSSLTMSPQPLPRDALSTGFHTDSEADDFASLPDSTSNSEASLIEVEDVDIESMSDDDDDGIRTPQSWSEVDSEVGDSERSESEAGDVVRV